MQLRFDNNVIWQVLDHVREHCTGRVHCNGCLYSGVATLNTDNDCIFYCAISHNPDHWQTDIVRMNVESEASKHNEQ